MSTQWQMLKGRVLIYYPCVMFIVNEIGKHDFSRDLFLLPSKNNLKDRKLFFDQINRNCFDPIFNRCAIELFHHEESKMP